MLGKEVAYNDEHAGMCQRGIQHAFRQLNQRNESYEVSMSCIEIYNDNILDLLRETALWDFSDADSAPNARSQAAKLVASEAADGSVNIDGLTVQKTASVFDALELLRQAARSRSKAGHTLNQQSSRSHFVCTLYLERHGMLSKLHFVDLAGSERIKQSGSAGVMAREAAHINKSLLALEQVIIALTTPGYAHVPYRQSELTHFLKDALGGSSFVTMISCIWPHSAQAWECLSTLRLAARMANVLTTPVISYSTASSLLAAQEQIRLLQRELMRRDALLRQTWAANGEALSLEQSQELRKELRRYLLGDVNSHYTTVATSPAVRSAAHAHEQLRLMREIVIASVGADSERLLSVVDQVLSAQPSDAPELDLACEVGNTSAALLPDSPTQQQDHTPFSPVDAHTNGGTQQQANGVVQTLHSQSRSFEFFAANDPVGVELYTSYVALKDRCKSSRESLKALVRELNEHKTSIDSCTTTLSEQGAGDGGEGDEDEEVAQRLKSAKRQYRKIHQRLQAVQEDAVAAKTAQDEAMKRLMQAYDVWRGDVEDAEAESDLPSGERTERPNVAAAAVSMEFRRSHHEAPAAS